MKKFMLVAAFAAFFVQAQAQTKVQVIEVKEVPQPVVTTFQTSYPSAGTVQWTRIGSYYVADYSENSNDMYVTYDASGKVIETGQGVVVTSAPQQMTTYVKTKYKDEKIVKVYKIKDANGKTVWKGKVKTDYLFFDENGNYIKMEKD